MRTTQKPRRAPGRPAATPARDARDQLLTAATELFAQHGVAATTFATIAHRAGMTPAMVHYYFRDREQLLDAVVAERLSMLIASVWGPVEPGMEPEKLIGGFVERLLSGIERMPWVPSTWMREVLNEGGLLRSRVLKNLPFQKVGIVGATIAHGQAGGTINTDIDAGMMVFSMLGLVMLHMATIRFWAETFHREMPTRETIRRHITGLLLRGIEAPPSTGRKTRKTK
ncbi:MAG: TetR/AcrR family transcriptional regulator [Terracidiphilus sp.]